MRIKQINKDEDSYVPRGVKEEGRGRVDGEITPRLICAYNDSYVLTMTNRQ